MYNDIYIYTVIIFQFINLKNFWLLYNVRILTHSVYNHDSIYIPTYIYTSTHLPIQLYTHTYPTTGKQWQRCTLLTATLFPGIVFAVFFSLNMLVSKLSNNTNTTCFFYPFYPSHSRHPWWWCDFVEIILRKGYLYTLQYVL